MEHESNAIDPMGDFERSHSCDAISANLIDHEVVLAGWVQRRRDHGGVIFVDLRDRTGVLQVVFRPDASFKAHARAGALRSEFVLAVRGVIKRRSEETINLEIPNGDIEVVAADLALLNTASPPPFAIEDDPGVDESVRLQHRIHDLRRGPLQKNLSLRHRLTKAIRDTLCENEFTEIETPILTKSTPEGARDFLVPARQQPGEFYALPQSPQLMKQLLMIAGFERYFQIARCFRDEDQRADRQLEFTQVDLEMSFVKVENILKLLEEITWKGCLEAKGVELQRPFPRISYQDSMDRFGNDRPDTRIQLELADLTEVFSKSDFRAFRGAVEAGGIVKCLPIHDADEISRGEIDRLEGFVKKELNARGLGWIRVAADGSWQSPIVKFLSEKDKEDISRITSASPGSLLIFQADTNVRANSILSRLRVDLGRRLRRIEPRDWDPLFVLDFPLFEEDEDQKLTYMHMPFVAPVEEDISLLETDPKAVRATHYDVVLNGYELGSGSLRNHRGDLQRKILGLLGYETEEMEQKFGFFLRSLETGAPPHGGFAFGLDRFAMVLAGTDNLRDVIAFPKTQRGQDLLLEAPSEIPFTLLDDLAIRVAKRKRN